DDEHLFNDGLEDRVERRRDHPNFGMPVRGEDRRRRAVTDGRRSVCVLVDVDADRRLEARRWISLEEPDREVVTKDHQYPVSPAPHATRGSALLGIRLTDQNHLLVFHRSAKGCDDVLKRRAHHVRDAFRLGSRARGERRDSDEQSDDAEEVWVSHARRRSKGPASEVLTLRARRAPRLDADRSSGGRHFLRGSSSGLTYVTPHGPTPCTWTIASSFVQPKCGVFGCMIATLPARSSLDLDVSSLSPVPMLNPPEITVTCSM